MHTVGNEKNNGLFNLHTFQHVALKCAKLKDTVLTFSPPFTTLRMENGLFCLYYQNTFTLFLRLSISFI